jgi:hypothetical protein
VAAYDLAGHFDSLAAAPGDSVAGSARGSAIDGCQMSGIILCDMRRRVMDRTAS